MLLAGELVRAKMFVFSNFYESEYWGCTALSAPTRMPVEQNNLGLIATHRTRASKYADQLRSGQSINLIQEVVVWGNRMAVRRPEYQEINC